MSVLAAVLLLLAQTGSGTTSETSGYEHLDAALYHYDTLHVDHLTHTASKPHPLQLTPTQIEFHTLGRKFHLHLLPSRHSFSSDFAVYVVGEGGVRERYHINTDNFYHGYLQGEESSVVTAHVSASGVLSAHIATPSETYHIEPSRHLVSKPHPFHMVAYKASHVKNRLGSHRVDFVSPSREIPLQENNQGMDQSGFSHSDSTFEKSSLHSETSASGSKHGNRLKRQTAAANFPGDLSGDSCPMVLVSDFTVFSEVGSEDSIINRLVLLVCAVDQSIFRSTLWIPDVNRPGISGLGLDIRTIIIHNSTSADRYNAPSLDSDLEAGQLLQLFNLGPWDGYCLAHLFTSRNFPSGLLGLANIASASAAQTGGICSMSFFDSQQDPPSRIIYNTGLTSLLSNNKPLIMEELILVTAHELGHNWGTHHDPPTGRCSNIWLMNEFAQDGTQQSHRMFSECSRGSIGQVLVSKGRCFSERRPVCGDYQIAPGVEVCDAGPEGDDCCTASCMLEEGKECSNVNHACCVDCQIASNSTVCRTTRSISIDCTTDTFCSGSSEECPAPTPSQPDDPCIGGICKLNGSELECVPLCETQNLTSCRCPGNDEECLVCCSEEGGGECAPYRLGNQTIPLFNGAECDSGQSVCISGECTRQTQDTISRVFLIIANLDINALGLLISENIVGFIVVFTLPCWCIGSCIVHFAVDTECCRKKEHIDHGKIYHERYPKLRSEMEANKQRMLYYQSIRDGQLDPLLEEEEEEESSDRAPLLSSPVDDLPPPVYRRQASSSSSEASDLEGDNVITLIN